MSDQIREQVSAFLDGELPSSETELLLKRLTRDAELRESFGRYALIGETLRGATRTPLSRGFAGRVNRAIDGEAVTAGFQAVQSRPSRWWRPIAGAAVAAGVAAVAVVALQQRAVPPLARSVAPPAPVVSNAPAPEPRDPYTVPPAAPDAPAILPAARLTNYVFAHSKYSSVLGQRNVLSALLAEPEEPQPAAVSVRTAGEDAANGVPATGVAVNGVALHRTAPPDAHTAP